MQLQRMQRTQRGTIGYVRGEASSEATLHCLLCDNGDLGDH